MTEITLLKTAKPDHLLAAELKSRMLAALEVVASIANEGKDAGLSIGFRLCPDANGHVHVPADGVVVVKIF